MKRVASCGEHTLRFTLINEGGEQNQKACFCRDGCHDGQFRCLPVANPLKDVCYPMFLQQSQISQIAEYHERYEQQFKMWRRKALEFQDLHRRPINDIYQPVKKGYFCQNCQVHFGDYGQHIKSQAHMKNISEDEWSDRLKKMIRVQNLEKERQTMSKQKKKHEHNKEHRARMKRVVEKFRGLVNIVGRENKLE